MTAASPECGECAEVVARKESLRAVARAARAAIPPHERDAAAHRLAEMFFKITPRQTGPCAGFWPLGDEIDLRPLMAAWLAQGVAVALPVTGPKGTPLIFRRWDGVSPLQPGRFGTMAPGDDAPELFPAVVAVPLLAFDRAGGRLGYGGGYYDRTLSLLRAQGPVLAVGVAFAAQEVAAVPLGPYDHPLDWIVTEREGISAGEP